MKKVYRYEDNRLYWDRRWEQASEDADRFEDLTIYPIRYAEETARNHSGRILEIGCGLGRLVKHYGLQGREIVGIERSAVAVQRIREATPGLDVRVGDALALDFPAASFGIVFAFGVYHNLEEGLETGVAEVARVLRPGGRFVISMRPQNLEMWLNEVYWRRKKSKSVAGAERHFHKLLITRPEFEGILAAHGLTTARVSYARNMSILFRIPFLRDKGVSRAEEVVRRSRGYRLNRLGRFFDQILRRIAPEQFSNVIVFQGFKPEP